MDRLRGAGLSERALLAQPGRPRSVQYQGSANRVFHKMFYDDRSQGVSADYRQSLAGQTISAGLDYAHLGDDGDKNLADDFRAPFRNGSYVATKNLEFYAMDDLRLLGGKLSVLPGAAMSL